MVALDKLVLARSYSPIGYILFLEVDVEMGVNLCWSSDSVLGLTGDSVLILCMIYGKGAQKIIGQGGKVEHNT